MAAQKYDNAKLRAAMNAAAKKYGTNSKQYKDARAALNTDLAANGNRVNDAGIGKSTRPGSGTSTPAMISNQGPFGSSSVTKDANGNLTFTNDLSAGNQGVVNAGQDAGANAGKVLGGLVGSENFGKTWEESGVANTKGLTDAVFNQLTSRLKPQQDYGREQLQQQLVNRGIPIGSDLYNRMVREQEQTYGDQWNDAANQATQKGFDFWTQQAQVGNQTAQTLQGVNQAGYYAPTPIDANAIFGTQQGTLLGQQDIASREKIAKMNNEAQLKAARISASRAGGGYGAQPTLAPSPFSGGGLPNS